LVEEFSKDYLYMNELATQKIINWFSISPYNSCRWHQSPMCQPDSRHSPSEL